MLFLLLDKFVGSAFESVSDRLIECIGPSPVKLCEVSPIPLSTT
ncbi:hypothetical Protein YC6258_02680 [Gynuella sunshinyii YC6258]|uniref:Uncharacterized protein n=1 Tax=Gynuella sunshinyii YC6258 TaxID=1445510 RepID=A0A0C5VN15_9GAMM|nr:hypothetical Protein YC6258_02680 [Gynuella sunshinyii YC6258]